MWAQKTINSNFVVEESSAIRKRCHLFFIMLIFLMLSAVFITSSFDILWGGDSWSDFCVLLAGENFAKYGFAESYFLPLYNTGTPGENPDYYMHAPPLPDILNGLMQTAGIRSLYWMRVISGLFFIGGIVCIYAALGRIIGYFVSLCGLSYLLLTLYFYKYSICILSQAYNIFFLGLFLLTFLNAMEKKDSYRRWLGCWLVLSVSSMISFDFILYCQVCAWTYTIGTGQIRCRWKHLVFLGTAPVAGVGLHFLQNIWAVGLTAALADNMGFTQRDGGLTINRLLAYLKLPSRISVYSLNMFHFSWQGILAVFVLVLVFLQTHADRSRRSISALLISILFASCCWYIFMPSHTVIHRYVISQMVPLVIITAGYFLAFALRTAFNSHITRWVRFAAGAGLLALMLNNIYLMKYAFSKPAFNKVMLMRALGENALPQDAALVSGGDFPTPFAAFFLQRPYWTRYPEHIYDHEHLQAIQKHVTPEYRFYYFFYGESGYIHDQLYRYLATYCRGKMLTFNLPHKNSPACFILFDMESLFLSEQERVELDANIKEKQLQGIFPAWVVPGFEEHLNQEISKCNWK